MQAFCFPTKVDLHVENAEPLLKSLFGHQTHDSDEEPVAQSRKSQSKETGRTRRKTDDGHRAEKEKCLSSTNSYLNQARAMVSSQKGLHCRNIFKTKVSVHVTFCIER